MKKIILFLITFSVFSQSFSQKNYIGFAFVGGYKSVYNEFGITLNSRLINHFDIEFGYSRGKFNGDGYSTGFSYIPIKRKLQPYIGAQYSKNFGRRFDISANGNSTEFKTAPCEFIYGKLGLMYKLNLQETITENMMVLLNLCMSYRYTSYSDYKLNYLGGYSPYAHEEDLNRRIGNGYGVSLSLLVLFGNKEK